jgi:hypothetical protein
LSTLRYGFKLILESSEHAVQALGTQSRNTLVLTQIRRWSALLVSHPFLFRVHGLIDILDAESLASKKLQSGTLTAHELYDIMEELPEMIKSLVCTRGKAVQTYYAKVTSTGSDTKTLVSHTVAHEVHFVVLSDYAVTNPGLQDDYNVFCEALIIALKRELVPSNQLRGFKRVFGWNGQNFAAIKQDSNYFVEAMKNIIAPYVEPQSDLFPEWVSDAAVVQAKSLQIMVTQSTPSGSVVGWETIASSVSNTELWRRIRAFAEEESNNCNLSVVLFFRKVCNIFDGSAAIIEQFNSSLTRILKDRQRAHNHNDNIEDIMRCVYNGPEKAKFDPKDYVKSWTDVFNHKLVSTEAEKNSTSTTKTKRNETARNLWRSPEYEPKRLLKLAKQKEGRRIDNVARAEGRGVLPGTSTGGTSSVRKSLMSSVPEWQARLTLTDMVPQDLREENNDSRNCNSESDGKNGGESGGLSGDVTSVLYHIPKQVGVESQHLVLFDGDTWPLWQVSASLPKEMIGEFEEAQHESSATCELCVQSRGAESEEGSEGFHRHRSWHERFEVYWGKVDTILKASKQWAAHEKEASRTSDKGKVTISKNKALRLFRIQTPDFDKLIMQRCWNFKISD